MFLSKIFFFSPLTSIPAHCTPVKKEVSRGSTAFPAVRSTVVRATERSLSAVVLIGTEERKKNVRWRTAVLCKSTVQRIERERVKTESVSL